MPAGMFLLKNMKYFFLPEVHRAIMFLYVVVRLTIVETVFSSHLSNLEPPVIINR